MSTKLSIIVPIYNSEKYLSRCLESICQQIKQNVEVIVINDASTDGSIQICKKYVNKFNFIKLINLKKNRGVSYCRNIGIKYSLGDYICFVDSDDKLLKRSINNILNHIKNYYDKELFILRNFVLRSKKITEKKTNENSTLNLTLNEKNKSIINSTNCWNFTVKRKFLRSNNICFKYNKITEDWLFVSEMLCLAKNIKIIEKPTHAHRSFEPNTLAKKAGYIIVISRIKIIYGIGKIINQKKIFLNKQKIKFLLRVLKISTEQMFSNIVICKSKEIKKASKYLYKYSSLILKLSNLGFKELDFLLRKDKNINESLLKFKSEKIKIIKNIITRFGKNNIILFCAGEYGKAALKFFINLDVKINFIIDNNPMYSEKKMDNTVIKNSFYLKNDLKKFSNHKIFICNKKIVEFNKIKLQLSKIGINYKNIFHFNI